jgi:hypothetical protein
MAAAHAHQTGSVTVTGFDTVTEKTALTIA